MVHGQRRRDLCAEIGEQQRLIHDATKNLFVFTDTDGTVYEFNDFTQTGLPGGSFSQSIAPDGSVTKVSAWNGNGQIDAMQFQISPWSTPYEQLQFAYWGGSGPNAGRLESITEEAYDPATAAWTNVCTVTYTYYGATTAGVLNFGLPGDLETAVYQNWDPVDLQWTPIDTSDTYYYRYYTDGDRAHCLELALTPQEYQNALDDAVTPTAATTNDLVPYSTADYRYNTDRQVVSATVSGQYTYTYAYASGGTTVGYNNWQNKTFETQPDGSTNTIFMNYIGQVILTDLADTSGNHWYTYTKYGHSGYDDAQPILEAQPSAVSSYTFDGTNLQVYLNPDSGVLDEYDYYGSDGITETGSTPVPDPAGETTPGYAVGYLQSEKVLDGYSQFQQPSADTIDSYTYYAHTGLADAVNGYSATIYPTAQTTTYSTANNTSTGAATTTYSYAWRNVTVNSVNKLTLQPQEVDTTDPVVTSDQNGSNAAATTADYYNADGELAWSRDGRGILTAYGYDPVTGALAEEIDDANTSDPNPNVSPRPSGWSSLPTFGQNLVTDYSYDSIGRLSQVLGPVHSAIINGPRPTFAPPPSTATAWRTRRT